MMKFASPSIRSLVIAYSTLLNLAFAAPVPAPAFNVESNNIVYAVVHNTGTTSWVDDTHQTFTVTVTGDYCYPISQTSDSKLETKTYPGDALATGEYPVVNVDGSSENTITVLVNDIQKTQVSTSVASTELSTKSRTPESVTTAPLPTMTANEDEHTASDTITIKSTLTRFETYVSKPGDIIVPSSLPYNEPSSYVATITCSSDIIHETWVFSDGDITTVFSSTLPQTSTIQVSTPQVTPTTPEIGNYYTSTTETPKVSYVVVTYAVYGSSSSLIRAPEPTPLTTQAQVTEFPSLSSLNASFTTDDGQSSFGSLIQTGGIATTAVSEIPYASASVLEPSSKFNITFSSTPTKVTEVRTSTVPTQTRLGSVITTIAMPSETFLGTESSLHANSTSLQFSSDQLSLSSFYTAEISTVIWNSYINAESATLSSSFGLHSTVSSTFSSLEKASSSPTGTEGVDILAVESSVSNYIRPTITATALYTFSEFSSTLHSSTALSSFSSDLSVMPTSTPTNTPLFVPPYPAPQNSTTGIWS